MQALGLEKIVFISNLPFLDLSVCVGGQGYLEAQFLGAQRNRQLLRYQPQRLSMSPLPTLPSKFCGTEHYLMNSKFHSPRHQFCIRIIMPPLLFHTIPNFTRARSTSISPIISYAIWLNQAPSKQHIFTRENLADLFTKGLSRLLHEYLTTGIGVISDQGGVLE
jgi:hypothetical protein